MENTQNKDSIESVINRIKRGEAKMAPKWFFAIKTTLFAGLIFMVSIFLLYSASLVLFFVKKSGVIFLPVLGLRGIEVFLLSLPWILFVVIFLSVAFLEFLIKKYSFTYKRPMIYSLFIIAVITVCGGILVHLSQVHERVLEMSGNGNKSFLVKALYKDYGLKRMDNIFKGTISDLLDSGVVIKDEDNNIFLVLITEDTNLPENGDLDVLDEVVVLGVEKKGVIEAWGIKRINTREARQKDILEKKKKHLIVEEVKGKMK